MSRITSAVLVLGLLTVLAVLCGVVLLSGPADAAVSVTPSQISPVNASTGAAINTPIPLSVNVVINNAPHVTIRWYGSPTGLAGTWVLKSTATNVHNGTHSYNMTWNTDYDTVYYWRVTYTYTGGSSGAVYHFTTRDSMLIPVDSRDDMLSLIIWGGSIAIIISALILVMDAFKRRR